MKARGQDRERGAALVEAALISPIVFLLVFAIIDGGMFFKDFLAVGTASRDGARAGIAQEADALADWDILRAVERGLTAVNRSDVELIVVFKATALDDVPSAACRAGNPQSGACNVYSRSDLDLTLDQFKVKPQHWKGQDRDITAGGGTDLVGVYVRSRHTFAVGVLGQSRAIEETTVMRMEPKLA